MSGRSCITHHWLKERGVQYWKCKNCPMRATDDCRGVKIAWRPKWRVKRESCDECGHETDRKLVDRNARIPGDHVTPAPQLVKKDWMICWACGKEWQTLNSLLGAIYAGGVFREFDSLLPSSNALIIGITDKNLAGD